MTVHHAGRQPETVLTADVPTERWPGVMADVAAAVSRRAAAVREDVYHVILREIPELRDDKPLLALLASSVDSNVDTCLQIIQHRIDLTAVAAPAALSRGYCLARMITILNFTRNTVEPRVRLPGVLSRLRNERR